VLHSTGGYMLYVATTFKYTFDHQAGGSIPHRSGLTYRLLFKYYENCL
jgi:acyl-coenzyme A synthetase/AMP-(fatty) acid ligase